MKAVGTVALAGLVALCVVGCATEESSGKGDAAERPATYERVDRPGSHLPVRTSTPMSKEEKERQAEDARSTLKTAPGPTVIR